MTALAVLWAGFIFGCLVTVTTHRIARRRQRAASFDRHTVSALLILDPWTPEDRAWVEREGGRL